MVARRWRCLALVLFLCWMHALPAAAEDGRIEGRVEKNGKGVAGVVVLLVELRSVEVSNTSGDFVFKNVPAGIYSLNFTLGESGETKTGVGVTAGQTREFVLEVDWDLGVYESVTVTAAAERAAKIVDSPAAVTSLVAEEIEQEAAHGQLPKVLEFTPGAEVTQSGLYDFNFNTRGFNSSLNRRVSTYIDGRDVGVVLLGAQEWAAIAGGLGDVAGLEFIRGPSAALYGANASSGVVNITTKAPRNSLGSMVRLSAGELSTRNIDFRQAAEIGQGWYYKVLAGVRDSGDFSVSRNPAVVSAPEYSEFCEQVSDPNCLPTEKTLFLEQDNDIRFGALRIDKYLPDDSRLTFEGGTTDMEGPVFQTGIGRVQILEARRPFYRVAYNHPRWNVQAHYAERRGEQVNLNDDLVSAFDDLTSDTKRYAIEGQGNWNFSANRGRFVIGAAHTEEEVDTCCHPNGDQTVVFEPIETDRQAIFSQFDWKQNEHLTFVLAGRLDWNTLHDRQFSPKAAMVYSMNKKHSMRFTYNEAFQVANYSEFFLHARLTAFPIGSSMEAICNQANSEFTTLGAMDATGKIVADPNLTVNCNVMQPDAYPITNLEQQSGGEFIPVLAVGNDDLKLEKTAAWEVGYSGLIGKRAFVTVDYYNSDNEDFITDLVPQVTTTLGTPTAECLGSYSSPAARIVGEQGVRYPTPIHDCPINTDYLPWRSPDGDWESTYRFDFIDGWVPISDFLLSVAENAVGRRGARLAMDLDGESTVVIARTYTNVGQVDTQGIDFGLQLFASEHWSVQASYSWFDFDIKDDVGIAAEDVAEILLPNTPEHKASLSVSYQRKHFQTNLSGRWVDEFFWTAGVFQGNVPAYYTTDLSASYRFSDMFALGVNVANLTDNLHHQTFGGDLLARRALTNLAITW